MQNYVLVYGPSFFIWHDHSVFNSLYIVPLSKIAIVSEAKNGMMKPVFSIDCCIPPPTGTITVVNENMKEVARAMKYPGKLDPKTPATATKCAIINQDSVSHHIQRSNSAKRATIFKSR
jgi:hypothetical protein